MASSTKPPPWPNPWASGKARKVRGGGGPRGWEIRVQGLGGGCGSPKMGVPSAVLCRAEFSRRWCTLQDGVLSYYENDRNAVPNGEIKVGEIVCLVNNPPNSHG